MRTIVVGVVVAAAAAAAVVAAVAVAVAAAVVVDNDDVVVLVVVVVAVAAVVDFGVLPGHLCLRFSETLSMVLVVIYVLMTYPILNGGQYESGFWSELFLSLWASVLWIISYCVEDIQSLPGFRYIQPYLSFLYDCSCIESCICDCDCFCNSEPTESSSLMTASSNSSSSATIEISSATVP